jgi:aspartokinase
MSITIYKQEDIQQAIKKIYEIIDFKKGDFLTITQGLNEIMIITNQKYKTQILNLFQKKNIKKIIKELVSLTINISEEAVETIGLFYISTRALNWENINIIDIVSTLTEMTFIIEEDNTSRAFNTLRKLININS